MPKLEKNQLKIGFIPRRTIEGEIQKTEANEAVEGAYSLLGQQLYNHNISIKKELLPGLPKVSINQVELEQVFINIINNARYALELFRKKGMEIVIRSYLSGDEVIVSIKDNGGGIPEDIREKYFSHFLPQKRLIRGQG